MITAPLQRENLSCLGIDIGSYTNHTLYLLPSHWCGDEKPHSGTVPYMEGPMLIHLFQDTACDALGTRPECNYNL